MINPFPLSTLSTLALVAAVSKLLFVSIFLTLATVLLPRFSAANASPLSTQLQRSLLLPCSVSVSRSWRFSLSRPLLEPVRRERRAGVRPLEGESNARSNISSLPELVVEPEEASESREEIEEREVVDVEEEVRARG